MKLNDLKKFAQGARRKLMAEVSSRLDYVTSHDDAYVRAHKTEITEINRQLDSKGRDRLTEEVAYTWFNRIVGLRFMDLRGYTKVRVVSPQAGQVQPELLFQIKQGRTPAELASLQGVFDGYLNGSVKSDQPDREVYTAALLGMCNHFSRTLPFLFRKVDDYMAVLLPTDLLSEGSFISGVQGAIGEDDVQDVEVIGWLYQFYISEKKDQVFGRPKGEKIKKEDIPAATQLFTPHWIVRYMVENSLGRLWRNNRPDTGLKERMEYYIEGDPEPEFLKIDGPEEITLLDPACGSGHILTYAFDLLYGMYEEAGYSAEEIPSLILTNNLFGIDIDTRAAELAAFALTMKAREKDRFFFQRGVVPKVLAMEDVKVDLREAGVTMSPQLQEAFGYLSEATNFGSLIPVPAEVQGEIEELLAGLDDAGDEDLFANQAMTQVRSGLRQLGYLARRYHCVVTNPPYVGSSKLSISGAEFLKDQYHHVSADLFSCFYLRCSELLLSGGACGIVTPNVWLYIESYSELREHNSTQISMHSLVELPLTGFEAATVQLCASCFDANPKRRQQTIFVRLVDQKGRDNEIAALALSAIHGHRGDLVFRRSVNDFSSIPGKPLAYWVPAEFISVFNDYKKLGQIGTARLGMATGNNEMHLRCWWEVELRKTGFGMESRDQAKASGMKWFPYNKGGEYRKWYGNQTHVVNWQDDGLFLRTVLHPSGKRIWAHNFNLEYIFREALTFTATSSSYFATRYSPPGFLFDNKGSSYFTAPDSLHTVLGLLVSKPASYVLSFLNPTVEFQPGDIERVPAALPGDTEETVRTVTDAIELSRQEWDSRETSWGFCRSPLLRETPAVGDDPTSTQAIPDSCQVPQELAPLELAFRRFTSLAEQRLLNLRRFEEANNTVFIERFGLQDEMSPNVPLSEITVHWEETDAGARQRDRIVFDLNQITKQLVSYGVGCIFGRYSLDQDGLILANAGDDIDAYLAHIPEPTLRPDESGILPITDDNDFADDLPSQWRSFLRAAFGGEHYEEHLRLLEDGLGKRLRPYFLKGFYDDHKKRYKQRPIYWLITSPKGTLQALIYLHRYNRDTVNRFLNDYLSKYQRKLEAKRVSADQVLTNAESSQSEKTKAQKRIDEIRKALEELSTWERDVVRPLAEKRVELDLDDGVKVNYGKLGAILAKVQGLNA